jgi:DNA-directed RNA polymerase specialized sigma24 family protein
MTDCTIGDAPATDATVRLAASGDEAAFARLVERHHGSMAKVAYAVCGDPEGARDATQDAAPGADPADRIGTVDLARALGALKPDDRALIALRFVAGLDSTEIAAQLHLSPSGVRSRLARLIERLRTELDHA